MNAIEAQEYYYKNSNKTIIIYEEKDKYYFEEVISKDVLDEIISIEDMGYYEDYVYDLETNIGTFQAGVGSMIVKNTDSVFCNYKTVKKDIDLKDKEAVTDILKDTFEIGLDMAKGASSLFKYPIELEFEKVYFPYFSFGKKIYAGMMYEDPDANKGFIDKKGIVLKRRDNPNITKNVYKGILDILFSEGVLGIPRALEFLHDQLESILDNTTDIKDLILTKTYKSEYKNPNIAHKVLAEKMYKRDPGNAPSFNDRVPYVFVEVKDKNALQCDRIEDPTFIIENNLKIDCLHYMEQLENPITQILQTFMEPKEISKIFSKYKKDYTLKKEGQPKITNFFQKK